MSVFIGAHLRELDDAPDEAPEKSVTDAPWPADSSIADDAFAAWAERRQLVENGDAAELADFIVRTSGASFPREMTRSFPKMVQLSYAAVRHHTGSPKGAFFDLQCEVEYAIAIDAALRCMGVVVPDAPAKMGADFTDLALKTLSNHFFKAPTTPEELEATRTLDRRAAIVSAVTIPFTVVGLCMESVRNTVLYEHTYQARSGSALYFMPNYKTDTYTGAHALTAAGVLQAAELVKYAVRYKWRGRDGKTWEERTAERIAEAAEEVFDALIEHEREAREEHTVQRALVPQKFDPTKPREGTPKELPEDVETPPHLTCPLTLKLMYDPVINDCGQTYERSAVAEAYRGFVQTRGFAVDPVSNTEVESQVLRANMTVRSMCDEFREAKLAELEDKAQATAGGTRVPSRTVKKGLEWD